MAKVIFDSQKTRTRPVRARLAPATAVKVRRIDDPWLRRYGGQVGVVLLIEEKAVEVRFPGGDRQFFLPEEVEVLDDQEVVLPLLSGGHDLRVSGQRLRSERLDAGISQAALARELGVSQTRVGAIEQQASVRPAIVAGYRSALKDAVAGARSR